MGPRARPPAGGQPAAPVMRVRLSGRFCDRWLRSTGEETDLQLPEPELSVLQARTDAFPQRRSPFREGRGWLTFRTAVVAAQVAWFTLLGWIGATLTLLPLALRGAPLGRSDWASTAGVIRLRLLQAEPPREVLPR